MGVLPAQIQGVRETYPIPGPNPLISFAQGFMGSQRDIIANKAGQWEKAWPILAQMNMIEPTPGKGMPYAGMTWTPKARTDAWELVNALRGRELAQDLGYMAMTDFRKRQYSDTKAASLLQSAYSRLAEDSAYNTPEQNEKAFGMLEQYRQALSDTFYNSFPQPEVINTPAQAGQVYGVPEAQTGAQTIGGTKPMKSPYADYPDAFQEGGVWKVVRNGKKMRIQEY